MTSEWVSKKLLDVAKIVGGGTPSTTERSYWDGDVPWITPKDLSNYKDVYISNGGRSITDLGLKESSAKLVPKGTVLFTSRAPIGYVAIASQTVCTNQGFKSLVLNEGYDSRFFYYLLKQYTPEIEAKATGSTFKEISGYALGNFEVVIPDGYIQIKIADFLSAMDDRITLLRETNSTLEAIAQALFKSWFVDFDPVRAKQEGRQPEGMDAETAALFPDSFEQSELGEIPKGWGVVRIDEILELAYGKALKATERTEGDIPVYGSGGITGFHNQSLVTGPSIIIGRKGTVGSLFWEDRSFFPIDTVFYVKTKISLAYCFYLLKTLGLREMNTDAAVPGLNRGNVYRLNVPQIPNQLLSIFDGFVGLLRSSIYENEVQIRVLSNIRDSLLPRLVSGQLRLPDAEEQLEAATAKSL